MKIRRISDATARAFQIRLCHISDTHGGFPTLYGRYDAVIHTGDFFPNSAACMAGNKIQEAIFQAEWLRSQIPTMKQQLHGHPFLYVPGNHDFVPSDMMEHMLRAVGVEALCLADKITQFKGVSFYGFPYVPFISGMWNYERQLPEMQIEVDKMVEKLNQDHVQVLACHAPPYKMLDLTMGNELIGCTVISNALDYKINKDNMPSHLLCGHVHEANGVAVRNGMLVSNAATTQHLIEVIS
jgi:Icc-related predicted phosphoesterase